MNSNDPRRLMVTGAHGFVAGSVLAQAGPEWEVHAVSRGEPSASRPGLLWHRLDSLVAAAWAELLDRVQPAAIIHTAAIADIDYCEAHPELATAVNAGLPRTLAELCRPRGIRLVHCSTDTVFDGEHAPYREADPPGPVNHYARTKVDAEQAVLGLESLGVVARLAVVVGLPVFGAGNSFVARMLANLRADRDVTVPPNEVRTPVDVITLGRALLELAADDRHHGIFHLAGNEGFNRVELTRRIAVFFGFNPDRVVPIAPATLAGRAPRPRDASMDNRGTRERLRTPMVDLDTGLSLIRDMAHRRGA